jgi:hypothetical protein
VIARLGGVLNHYHRKAAWAASVAWHRTPFYRAIRARVGTSPFVMPSVDAVIRDPHNRVLVLQHYDSTWGIPGGAIEPGEMPAVAVIREVICSFSTAA